MTPTGISMQMTYNKWDVWFATVKFDDSDEKKKRPILILDKKEGLAVSMKMTSHKPRTSSDYALKYWEKAGLDAETTVITSKAYYLHESDLDRKIGRLYTYDRLQIQNIIEPNPS